MSEPPSNVVFLKFRNEEKIADESTGFGTCSLCRNKTFLMIHDQHDYPMIRCAACQQNIERFGWVKTDEIKP